MPPFIYWPENPKMAYHPDVFDHGVSKRDILYLLSLHPSEVTRHRGEASHLDVIFSGGKMVARPTIAVGVLDDGRWLEIGFRRDFRKNREVCHVFHARYL